MVRRERAKRGRSIDARADFRADSPDEEDGRQYVGDSSTRTFNTYLQKPAETMQALLPASARSKDPGSRFLGAIDAREDLGYDRAAAARGFRVCPGVWVLFLLELLLFGGPACAYVYLVGTQGILECFRILGGRDLVHQENEELRRQNALLKQELRWKHLRERGRPYEEITGSSGHELPEMFGKVREKTIWSYWHHPATCPNSRKCELPVAVQLCVETVMRNRGSFDYKLLHFDEVPEYVSPSELPVRWEDLREAHQKDSLMNAILARYGGVALDISTVLLRPLDDYWEEMVAHGATFRGYMYRWNGRPWRHAEVTTVWFLMSRKEGIFSSCVRHQVIGMGDKLSTGAYHHWYLALGDQTLLPVLELFNYSLPKCFEDPTVSVPTGSKLHTFPDQNPRWCPEHEQPEWYKAVTGPERNDTRIMLRDPRDGPQLPMAFLGMPRWHIDDSNRRWDPAEVLPGSPMHGEACDSPKACWEDVFLKRFNQVPSPGEASLLSFVKFFHHASEFDTATREGILADKRTYFYNFLRLAGLPDAQEQAREGSADSEAPRHT